MPRKGGKLTPMERTWAERYAATGDHVYAAEKAGYRQPSVRALENMKDPAVMATVAVQVGRKLEQHAVAAVDVLAGIMNNVKSKDGDRIKAADRILVHLAARGEGNGKEPHEMTLADIEARRAALEAERDALNHMAAERSRPVMELEASTIDETADDMGILG